MIVEKQYKRTYLLKDGTRKNTIQKIRYQRYKNKQGRPIKELPEDIQKVFNENINLPRKQLIDKLKSEYDFTLSKYKYHQLKKHINN